MRCKNCGKKFRGKVCPNCADDTQADKISGITKEGIKWEQLDCGDGIVIAGCKKKISNLIIPDIIESKKVVAIKRFAFDGCGFIRRVVIPQGVKRIESAAFMGCKNLTSVVLPSGLNRIGGLAFGGCKKLTSVVIPEGVKDIGGLAFSGCKHLINVIIPKSVENIAAYAFDMCDKLTIFYCNNDVSTDSLDKWDSNWNFAQRPVIQLFEEIKLKQI
ncbi:MAG: leucine-rich repeat domain-containing protein [Clostridia bacterium]|nr:leucine-rich repeat domain-containing protein [Clostridia bacterium]